MRRISWPTHDSRNWSRRAFLASGTIGALSTLTGCATTQFSTYPSLGSLDPEIDIHCHVINIRDLPAYDMIIHLLKEEPLFREIVRPLAKLLVSITRHRAPKGKVEIAALERMSSLGITRGPDDPDRDPLRLFQDGIERFVRDHIDIPRAEHRVSSSRTAQQNDEFLQHIYGVFLHHERGLLRSKSAEDRLEFYRRRASDVARQMELTARADRTQSSPGPKAELDSYTQLIASFFIDFTPLCSMYRYRSASYLQNFVGEPRPVRLVTPACLDVTNWIEPSRGGKTPLSVTPIGEQVRILELLSLVQPEGVALHGFVGFDPAQWVHDDCADKDGLAVVRTAILEQGLVGVKLYPPIGFRAIGNTGCDFPEYVTKGVKDFGRRLDKALLTLYTFCKEYDVPIMAHCAHTVGPSKITKGKADPEYWRQVLEMKEFRALRLNLAHAGGLFFWYDKPRETSWTREVANMLACGRYPNLYADAGDVANFLEGISDTNTKKLIENMQNMQREAKQRLMYGTDWPLLARLPGFRKYRRSFDPVLAKVFDTNDLPKFFYRSAASFLGLSPEMETRKRLDQFYKKNMRPPPRILDAFLDPPPKIGSRMTASS